MNKEKLERCLLKLQCNPIDLNAPIYIAKVHEAAKCVQLMNASDRATNHEYQTNFHLLWDFTH